MRNFVTTHKQTGMALNSKSTPVNPSTLNMMLHDFAVPLRHYDASSSRVRQRKMEDSVYSTGLRYPWEENIRELVNLYGFEPYDAHYVIKLVKSIIDDIDTRYLEIRAARKKIFAWDVLNDRKCDIDVEEWREEGMVNWEIDELDAGGQ